MASESWAALVGLGLGACLASLLGLLPPGRRGGRGGLVQACLGLSLALLSFTVALYQAGSFSPLLGAPVLLTAAAALLLSALGLRWKLVLGFPLLILTSLAFLSLAWLRWDWVPLPPPAPALQGNAALAAEAPEAGTRPADLLRLELIPRDGGGWTLRVERPLGRIWKDAGRLDLPAPSVSLILYRIDFSPAWGVAGSRSWAWAAGIDPGSALGSGGGQEGRKIAWLPSPSLQEGAALSALKRSLFAWENPPWRGPGIQASRILLEPRTLSSSVPSILSWQGTAVWREGE